VRGEENTGNRSVGERGESIAEAYLRGQGFVILEKNYRGRTGEIDIVAREGDTIVFVEVKARRNLAYGPPQLAVTPFKQRQISRTALTWLAHRKKANAIARFDVIAILVPDHEVPQIEHIRNAFDVTK
jgi:putative endonuclease